jgi:hypothetical protein
MFGFPGSQVPIPEGSQVPTRKPKESGAPAWAAGWELYPAMPLPGQLAWASAI